MKNSSGTALASYTYDSRSRRTRLDYVNGASIGYEYDHASRLTTLDNQMENGQHIYGYEYDRVGNRMIMTVTHNEEQPETHAYAYDAIYQITGVDYPDGFDENLATDATFNYDAAGNRTSVIDGSGTCTYTANTLNQYTAAGTTSYQYDDSGNLVHDENYAYGYDPENRLVLVRKSGPYGTLTLGEALDSPLSYTTGGSGNWTAINGGEGHEDLNSAYAPSLAVGQESWMQTEVQGPGTISFWAKIDPADAGNELKFYVDDTLRYSCESEEWEDFSWAVTGAGTHTLKWVYRRNSQSTAGEGYVDDVGWTGSLPTLPPPEPAVTNWRYLTYTYDTSGRRIEKKYDYETITKYVYDGDHCIAEYNAYNQLKRKYIYGPGVDEPICMIDTMTSPAVTSYYHFDGLGSVVALTNSSGDTVEVYEYDVYGRVGASDASHPNRFMFTSREYDKETGLYYYRARYYNPQIGRFLQTDPVGYKDGMNWYRYCGNNPLGAVDPTGCLSRPTGEIMILYGLFTPASLDYPAGFAGEVVGVVIDIATIVATVDPAVGTTLLGQANSTLSNIAATNSTSHGWHAYIQVVDYNDRNEDGKLDKNDFREGDKSIEDLRTGSPYWVEIEGVVDEGLGGWYSPVAGYMSDSKCPGWKAALHAAAVASEHYPNPIPSDQDDQFFPVDNYCGTHYPRSSMWLRSHLRHFGAAEIEDVKKSCTCCKDAQGHTIERSPTCPVHGKKQK